MKASFVPFLIHKSFNLTYLQNTRLKWIDYLRGIAIVLVVYRHVLIGIERTGLYVPSYLVTANMIFYSFRMPLFFILSGLFISSSLIKRSFGKLAFTKFETILYPYFIWCFLQVTLQIIFSCYTNSSRSWIDYTYILYQPRELDQFWYLPALFNVTIVYMLVKEKLKPPGWLQLVIGIVLYYLSRYFNQISMLSDWMEFYLFFAIGDVCSVFFFKAKTQKLLGRLLILLLIVPLFAAIQFYYLQHTEDYFLADLRGRTEFIFISLFGCLCMFILVFNIQKTNLFSVLRIIGVHSLYIYVMHVFVAAFVRILFMKVFLITNPVILLPAGIVASIVICIMFYNLLIKDGPLWFLFSLSRKPEKEQIISKIKTA